MKFATISKTLVPVLIAAGIIIYPQLNEDADGSCMALERKIATMYSSSVENADVGERLVVRWLLEGLLENSKGEIASEFVKNKLPYIPPFLGCVVSYWHISFDKSAIPKYLDYSDS